MTTKIGRYMVVFAILSAVIGVIQIILGQTEQNALWIGFMNSYLFFVICFVVLGLAQIAEILLDIKDLLKNRKM